MSNEEKLPKTIKFVYENSDDYKVIYVNGIHGGITANGELNFDLFLEHRILTKAETHSILENGTLGPRIDVEYGEHGNENSEDQSVIIRERKVGVILNMEHAKKGQ